MSSQQGIASVYYSKRWKKWVVDVIMPPTRKTFKNELKAREFCSDNGLSVCDEPISLGASGSSDSVSSLTSSSSSSVSSETSPIRTFSSMLFAMKRSSSSSGSGAEVSQ